MFLEPQQLSQPASTAGTRAVEPAFLVPRAYSGTTPPRRSSRAATAASGGLAVRSLRRSITSRGGGMTLTTTASATPRGAATAGGYDVYAPSAPLPLEGGQEANVLEADNVVTSPEADDFAQEVLAMNALAMQRCRAEELKEALQVLNEAYLLVTECEQRGGDPTVSLSGSAGNVTAVGENAMGDGMNPNYLTSSCGGAVSGGAASFLSPQLLDQLKATTLNNLGVVECHRGQPRQALSHFEGARQLEERWNMCSPAVALNSCAAYNALDMYDKATAAALETVDMLRTLELQRRHEERQRRKLIQEQQQQLQQSTWDGRGSLRMAGAATTTGRQGITLPHDWRASTANRTGSDPEGDADDELAALIAAGQPQIADSDNKALWGAAWHNLAVAQVNTARRAARRNDQTSEFTNALAIFQNAMRATQELLGQQHPMTRAVTQTYRAVRATLRDKGVFAQHRTLMTAPPVPVDPRETEAAVLDVEPQVGRTRHATLERQKRDLTITFRGAVTRGEKLVERVDRAAYPGAPDEAYRKKPSGSRSNNNDSARAASRGKLKGKRSAKGCSSLASMPLSGTLVQAAEAYGNPHPLLYSSDAAAASGALAAGRDPVSWAGSSSGRGNSAAAATASTTQQEQSSSQYGRARIGAKGQQHRLPDIKASTTTTAAKAAANGPHDQRQHQQQQPLDSSASVPTVITAEVDATRLLLLAQPPVVTASVRTHYYPLEVPATVKGEGGTGHTPDATSHHSPLQAQHPHQSSSHPPSAPRQGSARTRASGRSPVSLTPAPPAASVSSVAAITGTASQRPASGPRGSQPRSSQKGNPSLSGVAREGGTDANAVALAAAATTNASGHSTKPRELFDAAWVAADTHYVRSGNRIVGRAEYLTMLADGSAEGGHPDTSANKAMTAAVMSVDVEGSLIGIHARSLGGATDNSTARGRTMYDVYSSGVDATASGLGEISGADEDRPSSRKGARLTPIAVYSAPSTSDDDRGDNNDDVIDDIDGMGVNAKAEAGNEDQDPSTERRGAEGSTASASTSRDRDGKEDLLV